jgi:uroporphyrinogen decarboxylase
MNSRERVFTALNHLQPDRVPIDFWATPEAFEKLKKYMGVVTKDAVLDRVGADIRYIDGPRYVGPKLKLDKDGSRDDIWGVPRKTVYIGDGERRVTYKSVVRSPLQKITTVEEARHYDHWPSVDWYDFSGIEAQCEKYRIQERVVAFVGDRTNRVAQLKPYMYLRGMENAYTDMILNRELFSFIIDRIKNFYKAYLTRILENANGKIDIFLTGDDFGGQNGLLCSRRFWCDLLLPGFREYMKLVKQSDAYTMHHTCGSVAPIIADMANAGLDILQSLQPDATGMEPENLKHKFGRNISFNGGVSIQKNLPFGKPEDVKNEVCTLVRALKPGGSFIIGTAHNIQVDTPVENMVALIDAYNEYLGYSEDDC